MALSTKRQQEKKARKQQKRKQRSNTLNPTQVSRYLSPIVESVVYRDIWERGIGTVLIARRLPGGHLLMANYLVDTWCLGVKDAFVREVTRGMLDDFLSQQPLETHSPEYCKALIMSAIEYGKANGLRPNLDKKSKQMIASIKYAPNKYSFEFGKEGKPLYINGPYDEELLSHMLEKEMIT